MINVLKKISVEANDFLILLKIISAKFYLFTYLFMYLFIFVIYFGILFISMCTSYFLASQKISW